MDALDWIDFDVDAVRSVDKFIKEYKDAPMLPYKVLEFEDMTGIEDKRGYIYNGGPKKVYFDDIGGYDVEVEFWGMPYKNSKKIINELDYFDALVTLASDDVVEGDYEFALDLANNILIAGAKVAYKISNEKKTKADKDCVKRFWIRDTINAVKRTFNSVDIPRR